MKKFVILGLCFLSFTSLAADEAHEKYGPYASPLSKNTNRTYFVENKAPDYWALISYYVPQPNDSASSAAALIAVLNASRRDQPLMTYDELVTFKTLTEKYTDKKYAAAVSGDAQEAAKAGTHLGVSVDDLGAILKEAAGSVKILTPTSETKVIHINKKNLNASRREFSEYLSKNEKTDNDFLLINFNQGILTGDPNGSVSHVAVVGGYDQKHRLVLILDPDRERYEPYWSPEDKVFDAVADKRSDPKPGYIYFKLK